MNLPFFVARRYLFSKKSQNVINIISFISIVGIATGTFALVVVLSVYNGFEKLIQSLYGAFDPDIKITLAEGKTFSINTPEFSRLKDLYPNAFFIEVIEENVLVKYGDKMQPAIMKGVSENYAQVTGIDTLMIDGTFILNKNNEPVAVAGQGLAFYLSLGLKFLTPMVIYAPKNSVQWDNPEEAFSKNYIFPSGIFAVQPDIDSKYFLVPLSFASELTGYQNQVTALEIILKDGTKPYSMQEKIAESLGEKYMVKNKYQQHELLYRIMKSEKWAIYAILSFILMIASFNVIGSITMLIIDKKHDIAVMQSMGLDRDATRKIFLLQGIMIAIGGGIAGIFAGWMVCFLQMKFHLVKLSGNANFIIDAYPVDIQLTDFLLVIFIVLLIGFIASWYPVKWMTRRLFSLRD